MYDERVVAQERDANNLATVSYSRGNDLSGSLEGAGGIGGLLARSDHSVLNLSHAYYHSDGNGNVTALVGSNQIVVARYIYDPYGNLLSKSGSLADANLYRFSSKEYHLNSGLVYYLHRYYEPNLQRWLNQDPIQENGGINLYAYVWNNPASEIDPLGEGPKNVIRVCNQTGKLVKQIAEHNFKKAMDATKESLDKLLKRDQHPVVHVPGDDAARDRVAAGLSNDGKISPRGVEQGGKYPPHVHPNSGPYKEAHVQNVHPHFPWRETLGTFFATAFAPTAAEAAESGDTWYFSLAAAWDALTWVDPVGVTDAMAWACEK